MSSNGVPSIEISSTPPSYGLVSSAQRWRNASSLPAAGVTTGLYRLASPAASASATCAALGALSNGCYDAVAFVNTKLDAVLGDGASALIVPDDGGPILLRVATMAEGIGARVRNAR